jgi:hypothetical protein
MTKRWWFVQYLDMDAPPADRWTSACFVQGDTPEDATAEATRLGLKITAPRATACIYESKAPGEQWANRMLTKAEAWDETAIFAPAN